MATATGIVIRTHPSKRADVVANKQGGCGSCSSAHSCHTSHAAKKMTTTVINPVNAEPGDIVVIDVSTNRLLKGLAVIYLLPVLGLLIGAIIGVNLKESLAMTETGSALLFGGIGLAAGFGMVMSISKLLSANDAFTPIISRIVRKGAIEPVIGGSPAPAPADCPCTQP